MSNIALPNTFSANTLIKSADVNADFAEVQSKFNSYAVQTDTAKTIAVTHTWSAAQTFSAGFILGGGSTLTNAIVYAQTITPASVAAATVAEQTFTVTGLSTSDKVFVNHAATGNATGIAGVRVSAINTIAISYVNPTAGALVPAAGTYQIFALR